ncbi:MAG: aspartate aminotransferase family protein [Actinobacteria bacterium]|nr:aspartate aminotransferase family protein [Actinomycetota bacterium]
MPDPTAARRSGLHPYAGRFTVHDRLPDAGVAREEVLAEIATMAEEEDRRYHDGQVSGSIYSGDEEHYAFLTQAYARFAHANVLQRDMYPSATKMEGEIIAMTADMLHGDGDTGGVVTSGGTESLMNAMLVYREWGRETKGVADPQVIMPVTAHPALDKGCHYFGIDAIKAPVTDDFTVDVDWVSDHIGPRTVALVGTAGTYPHGLVDDIGALAGLASEHGLGMHVDGCLGGFILPWGRDLGYDVPEFDLAVDGVSSMSADTHKYGYALKGSSVLLYRPKALRHHQYFMALDWPGGAYSAPGMSGSRSGGIIAATWASMVSLGRDGYRRIAADIFATAAALVEAISAQPELRVLGRPFFNVAFTSASDEVDIYHVNDHLASKGWRMNGLQLPPALHFCVTRPNTQPGVVERFAADLSDAVAYARQPHDRPPRSGAMYGSAGARPPADQVRAGLVKYLDATHEVGPLG